MWTLPVPPTRVQPALRASGRKGTSKHGRRPVTIEGVPRRATCRMRIVWDSYSYQQHLRILPLILDVDASPHRPPSVQRQLVLGMDVLRAPVRLVHALEGVLLVAGEAH